MRLEVRFLTGITRPIQLTKFGVQVIPYLRSIQDQFQGFKCTYRKEQRNL
jgi:hypothetical protein